MKKPKLLPVGVPWRIDAATPFMRVYASAGEIPLGVPWLSSLSFAIALPNPSSGMHEKLFVDLVGYFGSDNSKTQAQIPEAARPTTVTPPGDFIADAPKEDGPYRLLRLTFLEVADSAVFRSGEDFEVSQLYDCSRIGEIPRGITGRHNYRRQVFEKWGRSGLCPDPRMYEVESSPHLMRVMAKYPERKNLKHHLLLGNDLNVEIIASRWFWEEGQTMKEW